VACLVDKSEVELDEHLLNVEAEQGLGSVLGHHAPRQLDDFLIIKYSYSDKRQTFSLMNDFKLTRMKEERKHNFNQTRWSYYYLECIIYI
jgi:hypothetical protein